MASDNQHVSFCLAPSLASSVHSDAFNIPNMRTNDINSLSV